MRKFWKTILPPSVGFLIYFLAIRYSSIYFQLKIDGMGEGTVKAFMAYYRYTMPLLYVIALLTQLLIVVPVWDAVRTAAGKIIAWLSLLIICIVFAHGMSYAIWDKQQGTDQLVKTSLFFAVVQLAYWVINLSMLDILSKKKTEVEKDK